MRKVVLILISITIGVLVPLIVFEIAFRFMPVNEGIAAARVNESEPIFHFMPDQEVIWSRGWDFSQVNRVRVNNAGYINDQDYDRSSDDPLFAVIGDFMSKRLWCPMPKPFRDAWRNWLARTDASTALPRLAPTYTKSLSV